MYNTVSLKAWPGHPPVIVISNSADIGEDCPCHGCQPTSLRHRHPSSDKPRYRDREFL